MDARLSLRMQTKISPELVIASELLRVAGTDLEPLVWRELADNPALELASDGEATGQKDVFPSSPFATPAGAPTASWSNPIATGIGTDREFERGAEQIAACPSAIDQLSTQVALMVDGPDLDVAIHLLHSLDGHGYLSTRPEALAPELGMSVAAVERVIRVLHQLDPPGIGARDVRECFLIQCAHLESGGTDCDVARRILTEAWEDFLNQRWDRVAQKLRLSASVVEDAWRFMVQNFYPYPLLMVDDASVSHETFRQADLVIHREAHSGQPIYRLEIPAAEALELRVNAYFESVVQAESSDEIELSAAEKAWIRSHLDRARLFIAALNQRWATLRRIGEYLIDYQVGFLNHGLRHLIPLTRADVARDLGLHESTVSRAISDKIIQLPGGRLMPLSDFFDHSLAAKEAIRRLLAHTRKPLNDREIADHLRAEGLELARRTVAKYRQQLNIPSSYHQQHKRAWDWAQGV